MSYFRTTLLAGSAAFALAAIGAAPAFAGGDPTMDPYTYWYSPNAASLQQQPRAESCFVQQPIYNKAGHVIGHRTVDQCAK